MARHNTILVIDDEQQIRDSFRFFLEDLDYTVYEAFDGVDGIERCQELKPDLVLLDLRMARKDGLDVLAELMKTNNQIPVIVISGTGVFEDVVNALKLGAWDFLMKPVRDLNVLKHAVERGLEHARLRAENLCYQQQLEQLVAQRTSELEQANSCLSETNRALQLSEHKYRSIFEQLQDVYFEATPDGKLLELSPSAPEMFGQTREKLLEAELWALFASGITAANLRQEMERTGRVDDYEALLRTASGTSWFYGSFSARLQPATDGIPERYCGIIRNISERKKALDEAEYLAFFDPLTGLPNRRRVLQLLQQSIDESSVEGGHGGVLYVDVDRFKVINDSLGNAVGDSLIIEIGKRLRQITPSLGRVGADEFALILPRLGNTDTGLKTFIDQIRADFNQPISVDSHDLHLTVTIGSVLFPDGEALAEDLLRHAHIAMHAAKSGGSNQVLSFQPEMLHRVRSQLTVEKELRSGLGQGEFVQYFQPQVDCYGQLVGAEALCRWHHPKRGLLPPAEFVSVAEASGLIEPIGEELLEYACRELVAWEEHGLPPTFTRLAINISARQFHGSRFMTTFTEILHRTGANPLRLTLELTENILLENVPQVTATLEQLRELGVTISIDDFGTGYSSLAYLQRLPLGELKIDSSFVKGLHSSGGATEIVSTIIAMAQAMGMDVVAEGVESQQDLDALIRLNCSIFQGFHFSKPLTAIDFSAVLAGKERILCLA